MKNNDILYRLAQIFNFNESEIISIFYLADHPVAPTLITAFLKEEDDPSCQRCTDTMLSIFLNGLINEKRGKKDGPQPEPTKKLTNNIIFTKLKIALNLKAEDVIEIFALAGVTVTKYELSAFARKPNHHNYRDLRTQLLFTFLKGVELMNKDETPLK